MKCAYCSAEIKKGTGMMYVYKMGDTAFYCSNSCYKNDVVMGRKLNRKLVVGGQKTAKPKPKAAATPQPAPAPAVKATTQAAPAKK